MHRVEVDFWKKALEMRVEVLLRVARAREYTFKKEVDSPVRDVHVHVFTHSSAFKRSFTVHMYSLFHLFVYTYISACMLGYICSLIAKRK